MNWNAVLWRRLVLPLAFVLALSGTALVLLYARADAAGRRALEIEAGKSMLYVMAAVLMGNIVLVVVRDFEERRKASLARRDLLRSDLTDGLAKLYSRAKSARRRLRASVRSDSGGIDARRYDTLLEEVNDIQLGLEMYRGRAGIGVRTRQVPESVTGCLDTMEKYLGELVTEYETVLRSAPTTVLLENLPVTRDFIARRGRFRSGFVTAYKNAAQAVADEIEKDFLGA